jgi:hypothetical protein
MDPWLLLVPVQTQHSEKKIMHKGANSFAFCIALYKIDTFLILSAACGAK